MDVAIWNMLHDGEVIAAEGTVPGELRLSVGISYLCAHLPTRAGSVVVTLIGCERFEFRPYEQSPVTDPHALATLGLQLLSAELVDGSIHVHCADSSYGGSLFTRYSSASVATEEGRALSQAALESASDRYWTLWEQGHAEPGPGPDGGGV